MKEPPTKKQRNPKNDIFVPFQFGAKRKCSLNKRKFKSIQNAGFFTSSGETGKFTVEHKRTENFPTKKMEKFMLLVKTEKSQLKKESREFVQPKKKWRNHHSEWRCLHFSGENQKIAAEKKWTNLQPQKIHGEISIQKQKSVFN
jgi:rubredoxin